MSRKLTPAQLDWLGLARQGILVPEKGGYWRRYNASKEDWERIELPNGVQTIRALLKRGYLLELTHIGPGCFPTFLMAGYHKPVEITFAGGMEYIINRGDRHHDSARRTLRQAR
jgi:hypothetical protein